jgi:protein-disulfide isomerase
MSEVKESGTITIKKTDLWKYSTFILIVILVIGGFFVLKGKGGTGNTVNIGTNPENKPSVNVKALIEDNDPVLGDPNADVSIIEFSDFQCPFCARAHFDALAQFKQSDYFKNNKVNLVYKHFPLSSIHPFAQKSAEASMCAYDQGKFWEYHDILFENQADWSSRGINAMKEYAQQLGLNTAEFNNCLDSSKYKSEVTKELSQATSSGGQGTPYFIVVNKKTGDAIPISGALPWSQFEAAIQSVL